MLRRVFHKTSDDDVCLKSLCADETPQRGVNDDFIYTSSHTAQGLGLTVTVHLNQKTTCMTHCTAPIIHYMWFMTDNWAKRPEQAADDW